MAKRYSVADARAHLSDILNDVQAGEQVQVTRRGQPVAVVLSHQTYETLRGHRTSFGEAYREFIGRHSPAEIGVEPHFFDLTRDRKPGRRFD